MLFSIPKCVVAVGYVTERASSCPINYSAPTIQVFHWKSFRVTDLTRSGSGKVGQYKSWSSFFSFFKLLIIDMFTACRWCWGGVVGQVAAEAVYDERGHAEWWFVDGSRQSCQLWAWWHQTLSSCWNHQVLSSCSVLLLSWHGGVMVIVIDRWMVLLFAIPHNTYNTTGFLAIWCSGTACWWSYSTSSIERPFPFGRICFVVLVMRKGGESSWSGPWYLGCTSEVFPCTATRTSRVFFLCI